MPSVCTRWKLKVAAEEEEVLNSSSSHAAWSDFPSSKSVSHGWQYRKSCFILFCSGLQTFPCRAQKRNKIRNKFFFKFASNAPTLADDLGENNFKFKLHITHTLFPASFCDLLPTANSKHLICGTHTQSVSVRHGLFHSRFLWFCKAGRSNKTKYFFYKQAQRWQSIHPR